ncbi:hypothetical protein E2C01_056670 [Portunus trituberculatus]|uniref:Uncharacterized protein n=1 Tax=Portunus trituberculatus TaxID=210409 RepID=A0A5B7H184_PORTR|nr:hypothetical protein [Portunus trituberculatus]
MVVVLSLPNDRTTRLAQKLPFSADFSWCSQRAGCDLRPVSTLGWGEEGVAAGQTCAGSGGQILTRCQGEVLVVFGTLTTSSQRPLFLSDATVP